MDTLRIDFERINCGLALMLVFGVPVSQLPVLEPEVLERSPTEIVPEIKPDLETDLTRTGYVLGPGDEININVFDYQEFTGRQVILPDGTISLPLIGNVMAANRNVEELVEELTRLLEPWLVDPIVTIAITKLRPIRIHVGGEVRRPGPIQLRNLNRSDLVEASAFEFPTVSVALLEAGGITQEADLRSIVIERLNPTGDRIQIRINLWDALISENAPADITLQDGDAIFVPKLASDSTVDRRLLARSSFAPQTVRVRVVGEVRRPGEVAVPPDGSISGAIAIAGGPTDKATLRRVRFIRLQPDGEVEEQTLDLRNLNDSQQIQEGDVIIVPKSPGSSVLDFSNQVSSPFNSVVNLINLIRLLNNQQ